MFYYRVKYPMFKLSVISLALFIIIYILLKAFDEEVYEECNEFIGYDESCDK